MSDKDSAGETLGRAVTQAADRGVYQDAAGVVSGDDANTVWEQVPLMAAHPVRDRFPASI